VSRTWSVAITLAGVLSAHIVASKPQAEEWPKAPPDIQLLVRSAIADRIKAHDVPDLDLRFGRNRTVSIRREMTRTRMMLTDEAVRQVDGFSFSLRTTAALQAEADRTQHITPMFIIVNGASIAGDQAVIELGTDILLPPGRNFKLCCCWGNATFTRSVEGWTFASWYKSVICS
jgi:hypothetical protein